ncbi:MAG: PEP-CTERM sorting domain-containing protein, partial [Puniceicoccales bacterium]
NRALNEVRLEGATGVTALFADGEVTLDGGGTINLVDDPLSRIAGTNAATSRLINVDNVITGSGNIGSNTTTIVNQNIIRIDGINAATIDNSDSAAMINSGLIEVTNGSTLNIKDTTLQNFDLNSSGTIQVHEGGLITTDLNTAIQGGTLNSLNSDSDPLNDGIIRVIGATSISDIINDARLEVDNGQTLTLDGTIDNRREILVNGGSAFTSLRINDGTQLVGNGIIRLNDDPQSRILATVTGNTLNNVNNTIEGAGQLGSGNMQLFNTGSITATGVNPLVVDTIDSVFVNEGELRAQGAGGLDLRESVTNDGGLVEVAAGSQALIDGTLTQENFGFTLIEGLMSATGGITNNSGVIGGSGELIGNLRNHGILEPGDQEPAEFTITGNLLLSANSAMFMEVGGLAVGIDSDFIDVTGSASLGGDIVFGIINGFQPEFTDSVTLLSSNLLSSSFNQLNGEQIFSSDGLWMATINYGSGSIFDQNQVVLSEFTPVPEPSTYLLMALGAGMIGAWFWRRRSKQH